MRTAQPGDRVRVRYVKRSQSGSVISSRTPLELTVGVGHPRLPGLRAELVGLSPGQGVTVSVPAERAYGLTDPGRVRSWPRERFAGRALLRPGRWARLALRGGRTRLVRVLEVADNAVLADANHPWAGQAVELEVQLVAILGTPPGPHAPAPGRRARALAFDVDAVSLAGLMDALPGWEVFLVQGASAASLSPGWDPGAADLLVVGCGGSPAQPLDLCRFLARGTSSGTDARPRDAGPPSPGDGRRTAERRADAVVLALVPPGQEVLTRAAVEAGANGCLTLPFCPEDVTAALARARAGRSPGRHTLGSERAQGTDPWRDDGGES